MYGFNFSEECPPNVKQVHHFEFRAVGQRNVKLNYDLQLEIPPGIIKHQAKGVYESPSYMSLSYNKHPST